MEILIGILGGYYYIIITLIFNEVFCQTKKSYLIDYIDLIPFGIFIKQFKKIK